MTANRRLLILGEECGAIAGALFLRVLTIRGTEDARDGDRDCRRRAHGTKARVGGDEKELAGAMARYAAAELAASWSGEGPGSHPALLDRRIRRTALTAARHGLEAAYGGDRSDGAAGNAPACPECAGRMRHAGREESPVETALGRVRVSMARHACDGCGTSVRGRERSLDIECSMTPAARRMASLAGSSCCYAEADRLLVELAEVNYGAKRIERATRRVGDDVEARRAAALSGSTTVLGGSVEADAAPARKPLKEGEILCVALDGTGVPARPSETAGRAGRDAGGARTREAKVGALWITEPDGEGGRRTADGSVRYFAAVESAADDAGGGAEWLRRLYAEWFPEAVRIVDFFHAAESTCGRRRAPGTARTATSRSGGRRGCAGCSRRAAPTTCWPPCAGPAAARSARAPPATSPRGAAGCATASTSPAACPSVRGAPRRPARRWWGGA